MKEKGSCHVIQRERPQPLPGKATPAPARLRAAEGRSWPTGGGSGVTPDPPNPAGRQCCRRPTTTTSSLCRSAFRHVDPNAE
jgi:hypothetical protein